MTGVQLSRGQPVPCSMAKAHHFHWSKNSFYTSDSFNNLTVKLLPEDEINKRTTCCRCDYYIIITIRALPLSSDVFALLNQFCPTESKFVKALKLLINILQTAIEKGPKPLKVAGASFANCFGDGPESKKFFEALGYKRQGDLLVFPQDAFDQQLFAQLWLQFHLELHNKLLSSMSSESGESFFIPGEDCMLKIFGGSYKRFKKYAAVNPFRLPATELTSPYFKLGCVRDMDDELIWEVFRTLITENPHLSPTYFDYIISIAEERKSSYLHNEIAILKSQGEYSATDLNRARNHFGITDAEAPLDEEAVLNRFVELKKQAPEDIGEHKTNLKLLGQAYNSNHFTNFLQSGKLPKKLRTHNDLDQQPEAVDSRPLSEPQAFQPSARLPIGLDNIGNTCYLNSLLQYYFSVKYLRNLVLGFQPDADEFDPSPELEAEGELTIDNRKVSRKELALARHFVKHLKELFNQLATEEQREYIAPSLDLAKMSLGNMDVSLKPASPPRRRASTASMDNNAPMGTPMDPSPACSPTSPTLMEDNRSPSPSPLPDQRSTPLQIADVVELRSSSREAFSPVNDMEFGSQQDVSECMDHIMWQLEKAFVSQPPVEDSDSMQEPRSVNIVKELFYGETRQVLSYADTKEAKDVRSSKTEEFSHLIMNICKPTDIYLALDEYFSSQKVELDGHMATRELVLSKAPPFLQIQLQRVQFDRQLLRVYKSNEYFRFYDRIYLDRYMEGATTDPEMIERLATLKQDTFALHNMINKEAYLAGLDINHRYIGTPPVQMLGDLINDYTRKMHAAEENDIDLTDVSFELNPAAPNDAIKYRHAIEMLNITMAEHRCEMDAAYGRFRGFQDELIELQRRSSRVEYRLHAVFIHKGSANYGHYWIYIRDWVKNIWYKFNDEHVVAVHESEIFSDTSGSSANPYYIIYISSDRITQLLDVQQSQESS
ncbi:ubiquitin-specific protease ubp2 [Entomophthora muscae]|uniref:Ubiquitin-specific protease ubp2 n=1 Tax=Entomophthora muscae TaxID=34485 RepID=A0ACC2TH80_9FUNG|nr:ubiquitin-specific protease ubp2 [Entomophthora muscae]